MEIKFPEIQRKPPLALFTNLALTAIFDGSSNSSGISRIRYGSLSAEQGCKFDPDALDVNGFIREVPFDVSAHFKQQDALLAYGIFCVAVPVPLAISVGNIGLFTKDGMYVHAILDKAVTDTVVELRFSFGVVQATPY
jgi:hypothetical protein